MLSVGFNRRTFRLAKSSQSKVPNPFWGTQAELVLKWDEAMCRVRCSERQPCFLWLVGRPTRALSHAARRTIAGFCAAFPCFAQRKPCRRAFLYENLSLFVVSFADLSSPFVLSIASTAAWHFLFIAARLSEWHLANLRNLPRRFAALCVLPSAALL